MRTEVTSRLEPRRHTLTAPRSLRGGRSTHRHKTDTSDFGRLETLSCCAAC